MHVPSKRILCALMILCGAVSSVLCLYRCAAPRIALSGWEIAVEPSGDSFTVKNAGTGVILSDCIMGKSTDEGSRPLTGLKASRKKDGILMEASLPEPASWFFRITKDSLILETDIAGAFMMGNAPAGENRFPARMESQDNGIMMTALGRIAATPLHCLFDKKADIMILFPDACRFVRNASDENLMAVSFPVVKSAAIILIPDYYVRVLGLKSYQPQPERFKTAPVAWSSWYCYYMGTTEEDMVRETNALAEHLLPYGLQYVQLDACYTLGNDANYLQWTKTTFPKGGKWLFQYIASKGLKPALWVNVYGSNYALAEMAPKYPENFYLRDKNGRLSGACCTGDTTEARLDYTNPAVIETHLKPMFRVLKNEWGLKYLKDAGWGTWMDYYEENRSMAYDSTRGSREVYQEVQEALRETVGEDFYIGGCAMHEIDLCFGIFDGSRTGGDDNAVWYPEREGDMSMQTYFNSLFGANYLNNIVWQCDPDAAMVRNPLTLDEGRTIVTAMGLTGQLYMASDFMWKLPPKKMDLYQKTMPTTRIVPVDLYPYRIKNNKRNGVVWCCPSVREYPRAIDLKVNNVSGAYDVVGIFNWEDKPSTKTISLSADLGLEAGKYLVFDFWEETLLDIAVDPISTNLPPHGCRALVIRPLLSRPQFLTTSRHITGTVGVQALSWDDAGKTLSGAMEIVPGKPYSLFIHVPEGLRPLRVDSKAELLYQKQSGELLEITFSGATPEKDKSLVAWSVVFTS